MSDRLDRYLHILEALAIAVVAVLLYRWVNPPPPAPKPEPPAAAVRNADASLTLARAPDSAPAPPPHVIPAGTTEVRRVSVTVRPTQPPAAPVGSAAAVWAAQNPCPDVTVDLSLSEAKDGAQRVTASSKQGVVVGGLDIPIKPVVSWRDYRWSAGAVYGTGAGGQLEGVYLDRDFARLRVGGEIYQERLLNNQKNIGASVKLGIRW